MNLQEFNLKLSNAIKQCFEVIILLIGANITSVYIVCLFFAAFIIMFGFSPDNTEPITLAMMFVFIIPIPAIVFSFKGLIFLGFPSVLLFYIAKIRNKILWILLGAVIGQASYHLVLSPSPLFSQTGDFNLLVTMPMAIGMITGLIIQKQLYNNEFVGNENIAEPIFKSIFGESWDNLPPVMKKHYANRPYSDDVTVVDGTLDVLCAGPLKMFAPLMSLMGQIPARNELSVPVTVEFKSDKKSSAFHFIRTFNFKDRKPYIFHSRMVQMKDNEVIEIMRFGLGWKMLYNWDGEKVTLTHRGYALHLFGLFIPLPLTLLLGKGYAEETVVDDNTFDMITHITHPWWGKVYEYKGRFKVKK